MVRENLDRLRSIRDGSSWKKDIKNLYTVLEKGKPPTKESDAHIRLSFRRALLQKTETDAFQNRLRIEEVQTLITYKKDLDDLGESPWHKEAQTIIDKIKWFHDYKPTQQRRIVENAKIEVYEPGQKIFS